MFKNLTVRARLNVILIVSTVALLGVGIFGLINGQRTRQEIDHVYLGGVDKIDHLITISDSLYMKVQVPVQRVESDALSWQDAIQVVREAENNVHSEWTDYTSADPFLSEAALASRTPLLEQGQKAIIRLDSVLNQLQSLLQKQDKESIRSFWESQLTPAIGSVQGIISQLVLIHSRDTKADYERAIINSDYYEAATLIGMLLGLAILIPLTIFSTKGIVKPLEYAVDCIAVSQDIMRSLTHLSAGATETASAVTETTTTVEELKQTANISVEKAKDVLSNAQETLQTVTTSERSVMATIDDITQIRDRMQIISDSILKLSEKCLAIAEIMDSVSDIAEQSNLLAVNAAIESAKAGEVGRSFGVVAQEIRTLAEQSKGATVQVRGLLAEIQKATTAAVLATEQGSKAVAKGVDQSTQTSHTIKDLALKMSRVTQAANQIVLSNQQQLIGTEQITVAMTQINEATGQHVEHLNQIESSVGTLTQAGSTLLELTDKYRVSNSQIIPPSKRPRAKNTEHLVKQS